MKKDFTGFTQEQINQYHNNQEQYMNLKEKKEQLKEMWALDRGNDRALLMGTAVLGTAAIAGGSYALYKRYKRRQKKKKSIPHKKKSIPHKKKSIPHRSKRKTSRKLRRMSKKKKAALALLKKN